MPAWQLDDTNVKPPGCCGGSALTSRCARTRASAFAQALLSSPWLLGLRFRRSPHRSNLARTPCIRLEADQRRVGAHAVFELLIEHQEPVRIPLVPPPSADTALSRLTEARRAAPGGRSLRSRNSMVLPLPHGARGGATARDLAPLPPPVQERRDTARGRRSRSSSRQPSGGSFGPPESPSSPSAT